MSYTATNDYAALDATKPLDTEDAGLIAAIDRETRLVAKTVTGNAHTTKGAHRVALFAITANGTTVANAIFSAAVTQLNDVTSLTDGGNPPTILVAGTYLVEYEICFFNTGISQSALFNGTSYISFGEIVDSVAASNVTATSRGRDILTFAANTVITLRGIAVSAVAGTAYGPAVPGTGSWSTFTAQRYGYLKFLLLSTY